MRKLTLTTLLLFSFFIVGFISHEDLMPSVTPTNTITFTPIPSPTATMFPTPTLIAPGVSSYDLSNVNVRVYYENFNTGIGIAAIAYADFDRDGFLDIFAASATGTRDGQPVNIFSSNEIGQWRDMTEEFILGEIPTSIHPRKAIVADFNNDGYPDIYLADHGYDQEPWPGAINVLLLSDGNGHLLYTQVAQDRVGFHHGASAADIDNDGDVDIFVAEDHRWRKYFLVNNNEGDFTRRTDLLPTEISWVSFYTAELIDVDGDENIDLIVGGHESWDSLSRLGNRIYWGDGTGDFSNAEHLLIPSVESYGIAVDFDAEDVDGNGLKDLIITRTGSPPTWYQGYYIQILFQTTAREFVDVSNDNISSGDKSNGDWIRWVRLVDIDSDGDIDILVDDVGKTSGWINDGDGNFVEK